MYEDEVCDFECDYCYEMRPSTEIVDCVECGIKGCSECTTICEVCGEPIHYDCCNTDYGYKVAQCSYCIDDDDFMEVLNDEGY